jgi:Exopolyphosphatase
MRQKAPGMGSFLLTKQGNYLEREGVNMKFGILEIGSTNTKACIYDNGTLNDHGQKHIAFKENYTDGLSASDIDSLYDFINEIKKDVDKIYAFGTSIFRKISDQEQSKFADSLKEKFNIDFKIVSADDEARYTVDGVVGNINYDGKLAIVIGGGGSTELIVTEDKKVVKKTLLDFGAMDITKAFPDLRDDKATTDFDTILNYTSEKVGNLNVDADVLVLAGGNYIYFYQKADYEMATNHLYEDKNQPFLLTFDKLDSYSHDMMTKSWDEIKAKCPGNEAWWDGSRGMGFCMNAVARELNAKYIIPTKVNMTIGLVNEILDKNN